MNTLASSQQNSLSTWFRFIAGDSSENFDFEVSDVLCYSSLPSTAQVRGKCRLLASDLLNTLPYAVYRPVTTILKQIRGTKGINQSVRLEPSDAYVKAYSQRPSSIRKSVHVCLTHDIDTARCYELLPDVLNIEEKHDVRSSCNFLTKGPYSVSSSYLDEIENNEWEIGLHGDYHDLAMGFRNMADVKERLLRALDVLDRPIAGFRAPGLGISQPLLKLLNEMGFSYESSIKLNCFYSSGTSLYHPYLHPDTGLWELPLAIQDDGLFRDLQLDIKTALTRTSKAIELLKDWNGMFVLNTHPVNLDGRLEFYDKLLARLVSDKDVKIILPHDLVNGLNNSFPLS